MSGGINDDSNNDIENTILDEVQNATGVSFDDEDDNTDVAENEENQSQETDEPAEEQPADEPPARQAARSGKDNKQQRGNRDQVQRWLNARRHTDYNYDGDGSVVDSQGKVLFPVGSPARDLFAALKNEQFERSRVIQQGQQLFAQYNQQKQQLDAYTSAFKAATDSGLKPEDQATAMQIMVSYRKDPVQTIRKMLTDFEVDGGDLSDIFEDVPKLQRDAAEARLRALADRIEAPAKAEQAQAAEKQEMMASLNQEVQTFFGENPEAEIHADTLAYIIDSGAKQNQRITLTQAWVRLMRFCNAKGLSLNQSLRDQLQDSPQQQQQKPASRPMPGRGRSNGLSPKQTNTPSYERRNRDLVREAMEESGIAFD